MKRVVVLLARAPSAKGKTRLTAHLPEGDAPALRRRLFLDTLAAARQTGLVVGFALEWWDVDTAEDLSRWPAAARFIPPDASRRSSSE